MRTVDLSGRRGYFMTKKTAIVIVVLAVSVALLCGIAFGASDADFQKAVNYYKSGSYAEAANLLEQYVKEKPEGRAYYLLGYANYALGKQAEANQNFQDAYLVDPEMNPQEFRKSLGIDTDVMHPWPKAKKTTPMTEETTEPMATAATEAPAPTTKETTAPAVKETPKPTTAVETKKQAPTETKTETAPAPTTAQKPVERPRRRPGVTPQSPTSPMIPGLPIDALLAFGMTTLIGIGALCYLLYSLCLFIVGRKTGTGASWLAFVPVVNLIWPLVGAAGKSKIWILITMFIPFVPLYLWMCVASRFGRSKLLGLLFAFIVGIPLLNILFVKLVFKEAEAGPSASMGLSLPDISDEFAELPEVPGMDLGEEESSFDEAPAAASAEEEDFFSEGFGEEEPMEELTPEDETSEEPEAGTEPEDIFDIDEEEPMELDEEDTEHMGTFDMGEQAGSGKSSAIEADDFDFAEAEEATPEEAFEEDDSGDFS